MLKTPVFKPHFHVETIEPSNVYLLSEHEHHVLSGRLYPLLAPLLDGRHDVDAIVEQLAPEVSILGVYNALTRLESQGYIVEADPILSVPQAAFWSSLGVDAATAINKLEHARVSVVSFGGVDTKAFVTALGLLNIIVDERADLAETDLTIVLTDDYLQAGLSEFNQAANDRQKPWLLVKPVGTTIWLGPLFSPTQTGCWECLAQRLRGNRTVERSIRQQKGIPTSSITPPHAALPVSLQMAIDWAALETAKQLVLETPSQLVGQLSTFDTTQMSIERHTLVKRPQCQVCGTAELKQKPQPIALKSQPKRFTADGGHRSFTPEETLQKYAYHLSPISGVISNLVKLDNDSNFIYVYVADYLDIRIKRNSADLRLGSTTRTAGKGKTDSQSQASCICEALERYSGSFTGDEYRIAGTYTQLAPVAIHPNECALYSPSQYQHRAEWNPQHGNFAWVAEVFDVDREIDWTPVWSLTAQKFKYLPTAYCYYSYPQVDGHNFCTGDSNGNAAGHSLEEAIVQGFMELVERDCIALWWYNRIQRPAVDLDSFDEPYLQTLRDYYRTQNCELWVLDLTNDFNIPSFAAVVRCDDPTSEAIALGFGTHFDPKIAMLRAVTELNQFVSMLARHTIDPDLDFSNPDLEHWYRVATLANQPYLAPDCHVKPKVYTDYPNYHTNDLKEDVLNCVEIAANLGLETLVLDHTRPDIGLNVVKVIVPGLRHFWSRFAAGRLYDVPVQMGWLPEPLTPEQLNPIPMFF
jgi:oxazoline/thiazoline synthase